MKNKKLWILAGLLTVGLAAWASGYRDFTEGMRWGMADGTANATMESTGALSVDSDLTVGLSGTASTRIIEMKAASAQRESIRYWSGTDLRWNVQKDQDDDFKWTRYTGGSGGTFQDYPFIVSNTDGTIKLAHDLIFTERATLASTPAAGFGYLWVKNTAPSTLIFTDDTGTDVTLGAGGGGGSGTVTSIAISGSDGLEVDSGSPVTTSGTIALGLNKAAVLAFLNVADGAEVNATHTGEVTGSTGLTLDKTAITNRTNTAPATSDLVLLGDASASDALIRTTVADILALITGLTDSQISDTLTASVLGTPRAIYGNNFDGSAALTQIIASTYGGTGNGFTKFSGPASTEKTFTLPNASDTLGALGQVQTWTGSQSFNSTKLILNGSTSGATTLNAAAVAGTTTVTLPAATDTLVGKATTDTLSNKMITPRAGSSTANVGTPTIDLSAYDIFVITGQSNTITSMTTNLTTTGMTTGMQRRIQITGTGAVGITWGASFASGVATLPTTTVTTQKLCTLFEFDGTVLRCMATGSY